MSNSHLAKFLAKEKEISVDEARELLKVRRDFNYLNTDFVKLLKGKKNERHKKI